jgi:hypothetical protein
VPNGRDWARVSASPSSRRCGGHCHLTRLLLRFAPCCLIAAPPTLPAFRVRARRLSSAARRRSRNLHRGRFSSPIGSGKAAVLTVTARPPAGGFGQPPLCRSDARCANTVARWRPCVCRAPCPTDLPVSQSRRRTGALPYAHQRRHRRPTRHLAASKGREAVERAALANALEILSSCLGHRILMHTLDHGPTLCPVRIRQPLRLPQHRATVAQQRLNPRGPQK